MPVYVFGCKECNHEFEKQETIANRRNPLSEPCPSCGKKEIEMLPAGGLSIGDPLKLGFTKKDSRFMEKLAAIKSKHPGSTIKLDKTFSR